MNKPIRVGLTAEKTLRLIIKLILLVLAGHALHANAQTLTSLYQFGGLPTDGSEPRAGLVQGTDGNFYGTTYVGGTNGEGTVFKITPQGTLTTLYQFFGGYSSDGRYPWAGLIQGNDSYFYGTTITGGTNGYGTVFRISSAGTYTTLYHFGGFYSDGQEPEAGLVQGRDGNFYGTTFGGGSNLEGTVFEITSQGSLTKLWDFNQYANAGYPMAGLVQGSDGYFYGTTSTGAGSFYGGTVFKISAQEGLATLYVFGGLATDGLYPWAGLVQGSDGSFYGTTTEGGTNNDGTVFKITSQGTLTTLYQFGSLPTDGHTPIGGLVQGSDGNFYGTTSGGGTNSGVGTVFRISSAGTLTTLYQFGASDNGADSYAGLVQGSDGNFYGTTELGGTNNTYGGTVFQLIVPLNPPANQISAVQIATPNIVFNIPSIAYETYQLQFSSSMSPTNWVNEGGSITSIGSLLTVTNFGGASQPQGFYRFDITP
jgi:uncharacterized repeat protein (TIGR03803 family)